MPVKPSTGNLGVLAIGILIGASVANALPYLGVNFRLLPHTDSGYTIVPPDMGVHTGKQERIFSQFAHQLHPHCTSKEVHKVLNATWLKREMIGGIYVLGGWIPLNHDDSQPFVFEINSDDGKPWGMIYVGLSGGDGTEDEAFAFLTGTGSDKLRMTEFALCYRSTPDRPGRIERFTWWGIQGRRW